MRFSDDSETRKQQLKAAAVEYIESKLKIDKDWLDKITDSWIYDAEEWFSNTYVKDRRKTKIVWDFREFALEEKQKVYLEKYGRRDFTYMVHGFLYDIDRTWRSLQYMAERIGIDVENLREVVNTLDRVCHETLNTNKLTELNSKTKLK